VLEEDIAMANIGLDLIGQARMLYQHVAAALAPTLAAARASLPPEGAFAPWGGPAALNAGDLTEDHLAYFRDAPQFRNYVLLELPHRTAFAPGVATDRDYAVTIARNFLYSSLMLLVWDALQSSRDVQLAAIAAKSVKETRYHVRHSTDWLIRLGDGTDISHSKAQAALDHLMPYTQEFWVPSQAEAATLADGTAVDMATLRPAWDDAVDAVLAEATLRRPPGAGHITRGKEGVHSEHLSYLLADMQSLARAHPEAQW
jgi:ring-1,2-phenylacetyl-CoA epoxidase subunit PaaC